MSDWIEDLGDRPLNAEPVRGRLSRAYRMVCHHRSTRSADSRAARRTCRRKVRNVLRSGARVRFHPLSAWDVC